MTTNELTIRLAQAMGWKICYTPGGLFDGMVSKAQKPDLLCRDMVRFSPTNSRDDFALVLDEVARRGKLWAYRGAMRGVLPQGEHERYADHLERFYDTLAHPPLPIACECALKALEGAT